MRETNMSANENITHLSDDSFALEVEPYASVEPSALAY